MSAGVPVLRPYTRQAGQATIPLQQWHVRHVYTRQPKTILEQAVIPLFHQLSPRLQLPELRLGHPEDRFEVRITQPFLPARHVHVVGDWHPLLQLRKRVELCDLWNRGIHWYWQVPGVPRRPHMPRFSGQVLLGRR